MKAKLRNTKKRAHRLTDKSSYIDMRNKSVPKLHPGLGG